jgi:hypothetical protein
MVEVRNELKASMGLPDWEEVGRVGGSWQRLAGAKHLPAFASIHGKKATIIIIEIVNWMFSFPGCHLTSKRIVSRVWNGSLRADGGRYFIVIFLPSSQILVSRSASSYSPVSSYPVPPASYGHETLYGFHHRLAVRICCFEMAPPIACNRHKTDPLIKPKLQSYVDPPELQLCEGKRNFVGPEWPLSQSVSHQLHRYLS